MKKFWILIVIQFLPLLLFSQTKWQATSGDISFTIKNRGSKVSGHFNGYTATLIFSPDKLTASSLRGTVDVNTISTGIDKRDKDLKGETYFDLRKHRMIEMVSTKLSRQGGGFVGTFRVSIKGISKTMDLPFSFTQSGNAGEFKSDFKLKRRDFSVGNKSGLAFFLSDEVRVSIFIKAKKA